MTDGTRLAVTLGLLVAAAALTIFVIRDYRAQEGTEHDHASASPGEGTDASPLD